MKGINTEHHCNYVDRSLLGEKSCPTVVLSMTNLTWSVLGSHSFLRMCGGWSYTFPQDVRYLRVSYFPTNATCCYRVMYLWRYVSRLL